MSSPPLNLYLAKAYAAGTPRSNVTETEPTESIALLIKFCLK